MPKWMDSLPLHRTQINNFFLGPATRRLLFGVVKTDGIMAENFEGASDFRLYPCKKIVGSTSFHLKLPFFVTY